MNVTKLKGFGTSSISLDNSMKKSKGIFGGSVFQRKDGRWVAKYKPTNAVKPVYRYAKSEQAAQEKLEQLWKDELLGLQATSLNRTFSQSFENWFYSYKMYAVEQQTFDGYEYTYKNHIQDTIGFYQLKQVNVTIIQRLLNEKSKVLAYMTVKKIATLLRGFFEYAVMEKIIDRNPMLMIKMPKKQVFIKQDSDIQFLEDDEVERIYKVIECEISSAFQTGHWKRNVVALYGNLVIFMLNVGVRKGEMQALCYQDLDFDKKTVKIYKSLAYIKKRAQIQTRVLEDWVFIPPKTSKRKKENVNHWVFTPPKSLAGNRLILFNKKAREAIRQQKEIQDEVGFADDKFICRTPNGFPLSKSQWANLLNRIMLLADIHKSISPHELRHTFATRAYAHGVSIGQVSKWLGHEDTSTTIDTYVHLVEKQIEDGANVQENI